MNKRTTPKLYFKKVTVSIIDNITIKGIKGGDLEDGASRTTDSLSNIPCNSVTCIPEETLPGSTCTSDTDATLNAACFGIDTIQTNHCP